MSGGWALKSSYLPEAGTTRKKAAVERVRVREMEEQGREAGDSNPPSPHCLPLHPLQQSNDSLASNRLCQYKTVNVTTNIVTLQNHSLLCMTL